ncbi:MAG: glutamate--tRNA ligase family protein, partial [Rhodothermales bacterium]
VEAGYEPEALVNFLALLGWNPGDEREVFSLADLTTAFSLERVGQSGVQFDLQKLNWFNEQWLRSKASSQLATRLLPQARAAFGCEDEAYLEQAIDMMKERMTMAADVLDASYLFKAPESYDEKAVSKRWKANSSEVLSAFAVVLSELDVWSEQELEVSLKAFIDAQGVGMGALMFPLRMALSGVGGGPSLYALMALIGREETLSRIKRAVLTIAT